MDPSLTEGYLTPDDIGPDDAGRLSRIKEEVWAIIRDARAHARGDMLRLMTPVLHKYGCDYWNIDEFDSENAMYEFGILDDLGLPNGDALFLRDCAEYYGDSMSKEAPYGPADDARLLADEADALGIKAPSALKRMRTFGNVWIIAEINENPRVTDYTLNAQDWQAIYGEFGGKYKWYAAYGPFALAPNGEPLPAERVAAIYLSNLALAGTDYRRFDMWGYWYRHPDFTKRLLIEAGVPSKDAGRISRTANQLARELY
ncbi:hypothetical protein EMO89_00285 [Bifidobacterium tissieri]|uniref:Uncharacterized protein n=1 Tax=Bifidobacterium tissieri TaxID=1630162 RepID=A0A5M9ZWI4_9BIFI|nr:hypothetical protein [Bifidobacterium tissieri]KAA8832001.1 hypothetical protein EMO89_00285 [Bifidobacterium tissieri]